jgi:hypothetical protein
MKKRTRLTFAVCFGSAVYFFAIPVIANATAFERMSLERMSQITKTIARVRCVSNATTRDTGEIWTVTTFDVQQTWRGSLPAEITVRLLGGSSGGITSTVSGVPRFAVGEEAILFLEGTRQGDFSVVSWEQGTFRIRRNASGEETVTQDTASFAAFDPGTRRVVAVGVSRMGVPAFRAEVERAIAAPPIAGGKP